MKSTLFIVLWAYSLVSTFASYPFFGKCPNRSVVKDFNITKYSGVWYEQEKYFSIADASASCVTLRYKPEKAQGIDEMSFIKKSLHKRTGKTISKVGKAVFAETNKNRTNPTTTTYGRMITTIQSTTRNGSYVSPESYWVLDTDYGNFSVVWQCESQGVVNFQNIMILTRKRIPTTYVQGLAYGAIKSQGLSTRVLVDTDQEDCPNLFKRQSTSLNKTRKAVKGKKKVVLKSVKKVIARSKF